MADVSEILPDETLAGADVFNIEEVLVAWRRAGDSSHQKEPSQQFRDSFIVAWWAIAHRPRRLSGLCV